MATATGYNFPDPISAYRDPRPQSEWGMQAAPLDVTATLGCVTGQTGALAGGGGAGATAPRAGGKKSEESSGNPLADLLTAPLKLLSKDPLANLLGLGNMMKG